MVAFASIEIRKVCGLHPPSHDLLQFVEDGVGFGSFFSVSLGHFFREYPSYLFWSNGFAVVILITVATLRDQLATYFGCCHTRVETISAKLWVCLTLTIHDGRDVFEQIGRCSSLRLRPRQNTYPGRLSLPTLEFFLAFANRTRSHPTPVPPALTSLPTFVLSVP